MAPINRSHVNVAKLMIAKNSTAECTLGSPMSSLTVRAIGTKDRHSKVRTAKGLRDRRVRLSAPTAVQFFEVQDRLGFDQPSKALDWLIRNAQAAIDELAPLDSVVLNSERDNRAIENLSQETNIGQDVNEQHETTLVNVKQQQSSGLHSGAWAWTWARSRTQDGTKEKTKSDEVLPIMSAPLTSSSMSIAPESFVLCESKQPSTQQQLAANHHPLQQSSNIIFPQPRIPHSVHLPTYSFYTSSEPSGPVILHDFPQQLHFSSPAVAHQTNTSYCTTPISPGGTLQSIFNDVFSDFSNSHSQSVPIMELYPLISLHDSGATAYPASALPQVHKLAQQLHEPGCSAHP